MKAVAALVSISLALFCTAAATATPVYDIVALGLRDLEHTASDGFRNSDFRQLNEAGQVVGTSQRYNGGDGQSAWLYDGTTTMNIGLTGVEHTRDTGYRHSNPISLNEAGQVIGEAVRYNGGSTLSGLTAWLYSDSSTIDIGLLGAEHTRNDGYKFSRAISLNEAGQVIGHSNRYSNGTSDKGQSAWLYDGVTTVDIGLTGAEHTRNDGYKTSTATHLTEAGRVIGYAERYNGTNNYRGQSLWAYNGVSTTTIGFTEFPHTTTGNYKYSSIFAVNDAGHVIGFSNKYAFNGNEFGKSAWLFNGISTIQLGLTDAEHTRIDGYQATGFTTEENSMNGAGQVIGRSFRFSGGVDTGVTAWLYDGANTIRIGLIGTEHTGINGHRVSGPRLLNEAGQVVGVSERYNGGTESGESVWFYNGTTTFDIGLTGAEHTRSDGYRSAFPDFLNEAGDAVGNSERYNGGVTNLGSSTWIYNGTTTIEVGLTGAEHTRSDGYKFSYATRLNEAGQVAGNSYRFNGGSEDLGISAWFYDGAATHTIGLTGDEHTNHLGYQYNYVTDLNQAGQVIGYSNIYSSAEESWQIGQEAWLYDAQLNQTFPLRLSTAEDGEAFSNITYFDEDGLVMGIYYSYEDEEHRSFYFTVEDGLHDLESLVDGGLAESGWSELGAAFQVNGLGQLAGHGAIPNELGPEYIMPYLLTRIASLPGDFNDDHVVDAADYTFWRDHLGQDIAMPNETMTLGSVTQEDYDTWKSNFGATLGGGGNFSTLEVPEPYVAILVTSATLLLLVNSRPRRTPQSSSDFSLN